MALSTFDLLNLSKQDQDKITYATDMWNQSTAQADKDSWHNYAESIRQSYGYSGDTKSNFASGSGYTQSGFAIPRLGDYSATEKGMEYTKRIDGYLSDIENRDPFSWNKETDEGYQAFMGEVTRIAEKTFNDTIAGSSVGTGGRPNSWAGTVASQSMGDIIFQGAGQMQNFKDTAYKMYKDEEQLDFQKLSTLMSLDQTAYGRFVDEYNAEVDVYNSALDQKQLSIDNAIQRTELAGYVNNADALVLGVPVGTLSTEARQRAWDMEDYLAKSKIDAMYTTSTGGGDDDDSADSIWKYSQVENKMKQLYGYENGQYGGTPEERGKTIQGLYDAGWINKTDMYSYAEEFDGVLPEVEDTESSEFTLTANGKLVLQEALKIKATNEDYQKMVIQFVKLQKIDEDSKTVILRKCGISV